MTMIEQMFQIRNICSFLMQRNWR